MALLRSLPAEPPTALLLALATRRSMRWMLDAAGISTAAAAGLIGAGLSDGDGARIRGLEPDAH